MALAFLAHFVGDLHMPLHVGEKDDRGGNDVRVVYAGLAGDKINLHRIWDRELAERALQASPPVTPASITPEARAAWSQGSLADWTRQSWALSRSVTYVGLPALADGCLGPRDTNVVVPIPDAYATAALPVIRMQVERAGVRLGVLLDRALR
jgi:hypothetical protein